MFSLPQFQIAGKTVLVRVDYNVPLAKGKVQDNRRIIESLPTLEFLLAKKCKIVLATHLGRPEGKVNPEFKLAPIAVELQRLLPKQTIISLSDCIGAEVRDTIQRGKPKDIFLLENLRFYKEEEENNPIFAHSLASLADVYVNDAFSNCHRQHASMDAITQFLPAIPGLLVEKEINFLSKALHPQKPAVWILGGAKLDKIDFINQALRKADHLLIGGALAFPFLKAKDIAIGTSKNDP
ncbi:MAG TPA: phosphoglycerate kinase, partial [Candidatus Nanoarchaeia archaeon]|nr:phosphoglycerate kinase [Candidatus Nanoarchaeia archaeon]